MSNIHIGLNKRFDCISHFFWKELYVKGAKCLSQIYEFEFRDWSNAQAINCSFTVLKVAVLWVVMAAVGKWENTLFLFVWIDPLNSAILLTQHNKSSCLTFFTSLSFLHHCWAASTTCNTEWLFNENKHFRDDWGITKYSLSIKLPKPSLSVSSHSAPLNLLFVKLGFYMLSSLQCECLSIHTEADK